MGARPRSGTAAREGHVRTRHAILDTLPAPRTPAPFAVRAVTCALVALVVVTASCPGAGATACNFDDDCPRTDACINGLCTQHPPGAEGEGAAAEGEGAAAEG